MPGQARLSTCLGSLRVLALVMPVWPYAGQHSLGACNSAVRGAGKRACVQAGRPPGSTCQQLSTFFSACCLTPSPVSAACSCFSLTEVLVDHAGTFLQVEGCLQQGCKPARRSAAAGHSLLLSWQSCAGRCLGRTEDGELCNSPPRPQAWGASAAASAFLVEWLSNRHVAAGQ